MGKLKFIALSLLGFAFFLLPVPINGQSKIMMSHIVGLIKAHALQPFLIFTQVCAALVILCTLLFLAYSSENAALNKLFRTTRLGALTRIVGSFFYIMILQNWFAGTAFLGMFVHPDTGGIMAGKEGLLTTLYITFFVGLLALPLLTHFGAVEFIGITSRKLVHALFRVPGYSAVDAIASFVGDGTIGIVVTDTQYQRGYYNRREAYIIATSFSIVGVAFAAAVAEELGFANIFPLFYGSIAFVTVLLAIVTSRLPLRRYPETYFEGVEPKRADVPPDTKVLDYAFSSAVKQADSAAFAPVVRDAFMKIAHVFVGFMPVIMFVGTVSLVIAEYTPIFSIIGSPLEPVYRLVGYSPEVAAKMAPASLVGFADMYLPALMIKGVESESARFFIGVLAFTQLVFMSETGMILVRTKIGLRMMDVVGVFLFRTALSIPILTVLTKVLVGMGFLSP